MPFDTEAYISSGARFGEPFEHPERAGVVRIDRKEQLGAHWGKCINARSLTIEANIERIPAWVRKLRKLRELSITSYDLTSLPSWLVELEDLRHLTIDRASKLKGLPEFLWTLPRLETVWLFHTTFTKLPGIEKAPALRGFIATKSLGPILPATAERIEKARGVVSINADDGGFGIERTPPKLPTKATPKKLAALLPAWPRAFDARRLDLSGQTFEDMDIQLDLRGANLTGSTWRRCRFQHTDMTGARLEGATFEQCYFESNCVLDRIKAKGVRFVASSVRPFEGADLRSATFADCIPDEFWKLSRANLRGATLDAIFTTPQNGSRMHLDGADLRGATIRVRLTDDAAARVAKSKTPLRWAALAKADAQTDKATVIEHAPLKQAKTEAVPTGPVAQSVGAIAGANSSLWCLIADAKVMRDWKGSVMDDNYEELPKTDFSRALKKGEGKIVVGSTEVPLARVGFGGSSELWADGKAWYLLDGNEGDDVDWRSKKGLELVGARVARLPAKKSKLLASFRVTSGAMTLLLPYAANPFSDKQIESAVKTGKVRGIPNDCDALLVPVPNGTYEVTYQKLAHRDEVGEFEQRVKIARIGK